MFYAYGFDQVGVVLSDLYFVDPNPRAGQEGPERGARLEVRLFDRPEPHGSVYAARPIGVGRPVWRADLLESVASDPGSFDRTHHHPRFHGWEPDVRTFVPELSADPIAWVAQHLADLDTLLAEAGATDVDISEPERAELRAAIPEITDTLRRLLERVHAGDLAQAPAEGPVAAAHRLAVGPGEVSPDPAPARTPSAIALSPSEARRARQLKVTRRQATGLLGAVAVVFVCATLFVHDAPWLSWVQATAVASLVGGLADWFAVTALFRRPLGLPIPHTAIIVERKDRFGDTLGSFVQESFLSPDAVVARLRASGTVPRAARWLADPAHAQMVADRAARLVVEGVELLNDDNVRDLLVTLAKERLDNVALAPLAGRGLEQAIRDNRHQPVLDSALAALARYLDEHGTELHARLGTQSPWWLPGPIEGRVVNRLVERSQHVLSDMSLDRDHPLRRQLDAAMVKLAADLQTSPELRARGEELKAELLGQPQLRGFASTLWDDAKVRLRAEATDPSSGLHSHLSAAIAHTGTRLRDEPDLAASAQRGLETVARTVLGRFQAELAGLVSGTIARWDGTETSRRLELLLGPDLQYIRINGTVVGVLAGLVLHGLSRAL